MDLHIHPLLCDFLLVLSGVLWLFTLTPSLTPHWPILGLSPGMSQAVSPTGTFPNQR